MVAHLPPGPSSHGWAGSLSRLRHDPISMLLDAVRDHGEIVYLRLLTRRVVVVVNPEHVRYVLQENYRNYNKATPGFKVLRTFLADGLLTSEGDHWLRQRRIAQPAFHRERIASFADRMAEAADALVDRWEREGITRIDASAEMSRLTLRIVGETLLSTDVSRSADQVGRSLTVAIRAANRALTQLIEMPRWVPTPANRRLTSALKTLDEVVLRLIETRRAQEGNEDDLLAMLMHARDEETGEQMSDRQLRDEVMTIFLAGHETTAIALGWTWYLLSRHPDVAERVRTELAAVLNGRRPTMADVGRLTYTEQVIKESMRLFPPAWIISRCAIGADRIGGYDIPPGTIVFLSPYATHRLPRLWENPEGFDPDRFSKTRTPPSPFAYFPFGGGPRQCIGNTFAMMELVLVVAAIAQRCQLDLEPGQAPRPRPAITLRPDMPIRVLRRATTRTERPPATALA